MANIERRGKKRLSAAWKPANKTAPLSRAGAPSPHARASRGAEVLPRAACPRSQWAPPGAAGSPERQSQTARAAGLHPARRAPAPAPPSLPGGPLPPPPPRAPRAPEEPRLPSARSSSRPVVPGVQHPATSFASSPRSGPRCAPPSPAAAHLRTRGAQPPPPSSADKWLPVPVRRLRPAGNFRLRARPASPRGWPRPSAPGHTPKPDWAGPLLAGLRRRRLLRAGCRDLLGLAAAASKQFPCGVSVGVVSGDFEWYLAES